ncbi:MAG: phosphonoacetaldehyde hydrolase [Hyphomicrobiales bacterium]
MSANTVRAVVFDWAGTVIDHGSQAPMGVFVKAFGKFDVKITVDEARGPMGMAKRDHIKALMALDSVSKQWLKRHGRTPTEADIDKVYEVFVPMNVEAVTDYADLIEGAAEVTKTLRARGVKIGSTTGYVREIMDRVIPLAKKQGYEADSLVCAGDLSAGRPSPLMLYKTFADLGVWPAWRCVKVDDTVVGVEEGLNAGCWTVAVALTGNAFGLNPKETKALSEKEFAARRDKAYGELTRAGAHFVIDGVADLLPVIDEIEGCLARGERP